MKFDKVDLLCTTLLGFVAGVFMVIICAAIFATIKDPGCPCCGDKFYTVSDLCKDCADELMEKSE